MPSQGSLRFPFLGSERARAIMHAHGREASCRATGWACCNTGITYLVTVTAMSAVLFGKALSSSCQTNEKFACLNKQKRSLDSPLYHSQLKLLPTN